MNQRSLWAFVSLSCLALSMPVAFYLLMPRGVVRVKAPAPPMEIARPGVTKANFDRLNTEMEYAEIVAIMGRPPDIWYGMTFSTTYIWTGQEGRAIIRHGLGSDASGCFEVNGEKISILAPARVTEKHSDAGSSKQ